MDKVQKYNSFNTNTPSSEFYRNYLGHVSSGLDRLGHFTSVYSRLCQVSPRYNKLYLVRPRKDSFIQFSTV
jgi:hypothetical protein